MWITDKFVERPCCIIITGFILLFAMTAASFQLGYFSFADGNNRDYLVWDDDLTKVYDMKVAAID